MKKLIALTALAATVGLTACASDRHDKGGRDGEHRHGAGKGFHGEAKPGRDGLPRGLTLQYGRLTYTVAGTAPTTGKITAGVVAGVQSNGVAI